jgi:alpha-1,2-mannosyltransferase
MAAVFVIAPHQYLPQADGRELAWTPLQQAIGSTYVWFTVLLFVLLWLAMRSRSAPERWP